MHPSRRWTLLFNDDLFVEECLYKDIAPKPTDLLVELWSNNVAQQWQEEEGQ